MDAQVMARWQFGITTVYHFFFVPITIGLTWLVAVLETMYLRKKDDDYLRLVRFFGKLMLINFAAGVVTGIVQEFQFGMNWSEYSRFVGDIFGIPLALEALLAFFLESTFLGLWIFGWDKLRPGAHNLMMYMTAFGSTASAVFILAANCFMQNPVGATYNNGRAELVDFGALFTNPFFLVTIPHQIGASFMVAGGLLAGISGWKLAKIAKASRQAAITTGDDAKAGSTLAATATDPHRSAWRKTAKAGAWVLLVASLVTFGSGHAQAQVEARFQPMKLAASEGLLDTKTAAGFAIVGIYTQDRVDGVTKVNEVFSWEVPYVLSFLAFNDPNAEVKGVNDLTQEFLTDGFYAADGTRNQLQEEASARVADLSIDPVPNVMVNFYSFRLMIGLGTLGAIAALWMLIQLRKDRDAPSKGFAYGLWQVFMVLLPLGPLFANSFGWILTEMGRQPWIVMGVLPTWTAVSPSVSFGEVLFSTIGYTLVYGVVAVIVVKLFMSTIAKGLPKEVEAVEPNLENDDELAFAY